MREALEPQPVGAPVPPGGQLPTASEVSCRASHGWAGFGLIWGFGSGVWIWLLAFIYYDSAWIWLDSGWRSVGFGLISAGFGLASAWIFNFRLLLFGVLFILASRMLAQLSGRS